MSACWQVFWQLTGALVLIILLPTAAVKTQPATYVFTTFSYEDYGNPSRTYIALLGLLYTQFTINGYGVHCGLRMAWSWLLHKPASCCFIAAILPLRILMRGRNDGDDRQVCCVAQLVQAWHLLNCSGCSATALADPVA